VCCDGTWDGPAGPPDSDGAPTNVSKLAAAIARVDANGHPQQVFYEPGVGTGGWLDHWVGGLWGWGISKRILNAYRFVVEVYEPGDTVFLFGFSRGAYTVRSLAGLIRNCGVLRPPFRDRIGDAYKLYRRRDTASCPDRRESQLFRHEYAFEIRIRFIGVWETVGDLGIPICLPWVPKSWVRAIRQAWEFHDVDLGANVDNAYQAIAIDEKRSQYKPTLWHQKPDAVGRQTLSQVWFAGTHRNVGGGFRDPGLSDLALKWMIERASEHGLEFDADLLAKTLHPNYLGTIQNTKAGIFAVLPNAVRRMDPGGVTSESAHVTAVERLESRALAPAYRPHNLLHYLRIGGKIT
jgi:uncharacterized protein (DUF2235 family)